MKLVFITGAVRGIGRALALALSGAGFAVRACSRSRSDLTSLADESDGRILTDRLDVCDNQAVKAWITAGCSEAGLLPWGLVTVAGVHGAIDPLIHASWEEWRRGVEVNLFGSVLPAKCFAEVLVQRALPGRILLFSGGGATKPIPNLSSYCAGKAGLVRFSETLAHELRPYGITVNAIAPGNVNTTLTQTIIDAGPQHAGDALYRTVEQQLQNTSHTPERAVALVGYLLGDSSQQITGRLLSAVWDQWETLHERAEILENPDIYTLRRVTPNEAGR